MDRTVWSTPFAKAWLRWACIYCSSMGLPQAILHWRVLGLEGMCRPHNLNFSSYWWEKNVVKWPAGVQPRFSFINQVYFVIVWSEAMSFIGSSILIFWVLERKKSKQLWLPLVRPAVWGQTEQTSYFMPQTFHFTSKAARQVNQTDGPWYFISSLTQGQSESPLLHCQEKLSPWFAYRDVLSLIHEAFTTYWAHAVCQA